MRQRPVVEHPSPALVSLVALWLSRRTPRSQALYNTMAGPKAEDGLAVLQNSILSIKSLIDSFQLALQVPIAQHPDLENPPQPLALLSDSCKILKAQTTKLSLLILNKPFTPSAITYILNTCSSGCLPAMISALELCPSEKYSSLLHDRIKSSISRIMTELVNLIDSIPQDERGLEPQSRDTLASTGVLWAECDKLVTLASEGIVSLALQKAEDYHSLLKDAIEELAQWDPEEEDESDTDSLSSHKQTTRTTPPSMDTDPATSFEALTITNMVDLKERSLSTLRTIRLLYPALKKRRIATFPNINSSTPLDLLPRPTDIASLDSLMSSAQHFSEAADEIAGALYESDEERVLKRLKELMESAEKCATSSKQNWKDEDDEFSAWLNKWLASSRVIRESVIGDSLGSA